MLPRVDAISAGHAATAALLLLLVAGEGAQPSVQAPEETERQELPPRRAIDGVAGLHSTSRIVFESRPDRPHLLEVAFAFPARARWAIEAEGGEPGARSLRFRSGARVFELAPHDAHSQEMLRGERDLALLQLELRRAAMLWPAGFEWQEADGVLRAHVGELGTLEARLPEGGRRPRSMTSRTADGAAFEQLDELRWKESAGRTVPAGWSLSHAGQRVWREEVLSVDLGARFVDAYFLPPDRRAPPAGADVHADVVDLPRRVHLRLPLEEGATVESARRREGEARAALREELAARELELDPFGVLELDALGRPTAALLALSRPAPPPGPEWSESPEGVGLSRLVPRSEDGAAPQVATALAALLRETPPNTRPGRPLLLFSGGRPENGRLRLIVPLLPADSER